MSEHTMVKVSVPLNRDHPTEHQIIRSIEQGTSRCFIKGENIPANATVRLPAGALVARTATKTTRDWATKQPGFGYRITILVVDPNSTHGFSEAWSKDFKTSNGRWGKTTASVVRDLLDTHTVATSGFTPEWGTEYRGRNPRSAICRWCGYTVHYNSGYWYGWGAAEWFEHESICAEVPCANGDTCYKCGVTVTRNNGKREFVHGQDHVWVAKHDDHLACTETPIPSYEDLEAEYQARRAKAEREAREERERLARLNEQAKAARVERDADRARETSQARVEAEAEARRVGNLLPAVSTTERLVTSKPIWRGAGLAHLIEHTVSLSDGTTGTRWQVRWGATRSEGHDHDAYFGIEEDARADYRSVFFATPAPAGIKEPTVAKARIDPDYDGPTKSVSRSSGDGPHEGSSRYLKGRPERVTWYVTEDVDEPGWGFSDVPGYDAHGNRRSGFVVPLTTSSEYFAEDGLSFGLGDDSGYMYSAEVRPATLEEARPLLIDEKWEIQSRAARITMKAVLSGHDCHPYDKPLMGLTPDEAEPIPSGKTLLSYRDQRLYVDWWGNVVWEVTYNGADGDTWAASNWGGTIARSWPLTPERIDAINDMFDLFPPEK